MNKILHHIGLLAAMIGLNAAVVRAEILQLAAGASQSVALVTGGDVLQWGEWGGPLPVSVFGVEQLKALAVGEHHVLALRSDGTVWAWGDNSFGQLGNGTVINAERPGRVMDIAGARAIAAAGKQSYALKNDGTVFAWGNNTAGQLGDGTVQYRRGPVLMEGLIDVVAIAAGDNAFAALRKNGSVCILKLGPAGSVLDCKTPFNNVTALAADSIAIYLLLRNGTVHTLGGGSCARDVTPEEPIIDQVRALSAGKAHVLFLKEDGTVFSCGYNGEGQLGDSTTENHSRPVQVAGSLNGVTQIAAGGAHSLAATESGVWSWGNNSAGQLGTGNTTPRNTPGPIWDGTGRLR